MRERMRRAGLTVVGYDRNPDVSDVDSLAGAGRGAAAPEGRVGDGARRRRRPAPRSRSSPTCSARATWSSTAATRAGPTTSPTPSCSRRSRHRLRRLRRLRRRLGPGERLRPDVRRRRRRHREGPAGLRRAQARGRLRLRPRRQGRRRPLLQDGPQRHRVRASCRPTPRAGSCSSQVELTDNVTEVFRSWREGTVIRSLAARPAWSRALDEDPGLDADRRLRRGLRRGPLDRRGGIENAVADARRSPPRCSPASSRARTTRRP